ncbi:hypothetical protein [Flagellimonas sp.]|jgi:hypothetical protein|uniref:hypothetical protein n=1 Tax=Flagellimonas sp. TaxID=2058762 RepID=UPI003BAD15C8
MVRNKIYIWDDNDTPNDSTDDVLIGSFDAHNNVVSTSKGNWPDGIYDMLDRFKLYKHTKSTDIEPRIPARVDKNGTRTFMSRDSRNGAYGSNGIYRARNFKDARIGQTRRGMGVHGGREYKEFSNRITNGCIRCEQSFFPAMENAIKQYGSLTEIVVVNNSRGSNEKVDVNPQPVTPFPVEPPTVDPPNIIPPVTPAPIPDPEPPLPVVIPLRIPDSGVGL